MLKSEARKLYLEKRKALTPNECLKLDDLLLIQLQRMDWSNVCCVGNFFPMESQNEPNSLLLAKYLHAILPGLTLAYPRIQANGNEMDFYAETDTLSENKWGIQEPLPLNKVLPQQMDAILVPLLCFDQRGQRIGFGKGYYDRYFELYPKQHLRIGISYFEPIANIQDTHQFDVPLTHCITPWNIYEF
jgi:5-formyltetrahydrofolate cyclo-ligase